MSDPQERDRVASGTIVVVAVVSIAVFVAAVETTRLMLRDRTPSRVSAIPAEVGRGTPFATTLFEEENAIDLRARKRTELGRYRKIDADHAEIPIERAMEIIAAQKGGAP